MDVDWDGWYGAEIQTDITKWDYKYEPGHFDVIWASPDCRMYSMARTRGPPRDFVSSDLLVQTCLDIISFLAPRCFFYGEPRFGIFKDKAVCRRSALCKG